MVEVFSSEVKGSFPEDSFRYDLSNMKKIIDGCIEDIKKGYNQQFRNVLVTIKKTPGMRMIHCGMGASGIAAEIMKVYLASENIHLETVNDYSIPGELKNTDLVMITSYSGNTEEALSCYRQARRVGCQLILFTSGGKLEEAASSGRTPLIKLQKGYPQRSALFLIFFTFLRVLEDAGIIPQKIAEVQELTTKISKQAMEEFGINLSEKIYGKIPLIYSGSSFYPIAYRWKTQFNENSKTVAFSNQFPELDHNELAGFEVKNGIFHVVMLSTDSEHSRMRKRMQITKDLLQKAGVEVTELHLKGNLLTKIFTAVYAGDLASYYLALRYKVDPSPVKSIEQLKREMGPFI